MIPFCSLMGYFERMLSKYFPRAYSDGEEMFCFEKGFCVIFPGRPASKVLVYGVGKGVDRDVESGFLKDILEKMTAEERVEELLREVFPDAVRDVVRDVYVRKGAEENKGKVVVKRVSGGFLVELVGNGVKWTRKVDYDDLFVAYELELRELGRQGRRMACWQGITSRVPLYDDPRRGLDVFFVGGLETEEDLQEFRDALRDSFRRYISGALMYAFGIDNACSCLSDDYGRFYECCCKRDGVELRVILKVFND